MTLLSNFSFGQDIPIIPLPNEFEQNDVNFKLSNQTSVILRDSIFKSEARFLENKILDYTGISVLRDRDKATHKIVLTTSNSDTFLKENGAYEIKMDEDKIKIKASNGDGMFNGVISLLQLIRKTEENQGTFLVSCWNIKDRPSYQWRGIMLDESRHFFGKQVVKEILDQMAWLKLNIFHWHLTDEPGWRIEIKKYPLLALIGGIGNDTDSLAPAQFYTQDDIREIVTYAKKRHIKVIPEIDMPGHATAANRAYPEYSGGGSKQFPDFTFNPAEEGTYTYLTNILKEISVLFPSHMIHLGGDEVSFGIKGWKEIPEVQNLMKRKKLKSLKEVENYFLKRMADSALTRFKDILVWDDALDADLSKKNTVIYWWRHDKPEQLAKALKKDYAVVLMPRIPLYFDFIQDSTHIQGREWGKNFSSLRQVYKFSIDNYLSEIENKENVLGMQGNLWTEQIRTSKRLEFMTFPRIDALAEMSWTRDRNKDYQSFLKRLKAQLILYKKEDIKFYNPLEPQKTPEVVDL